MTTTEFDQEATKYTDKFYEQHLSGSASSARVLLQDLIRHYSPQSVVDLGCGHGAWLQAARSLGIQDILGVDGSYVNQSALLIDAANFKAADLRERQAFERRFDLAISVEVAEHLPAERAETFVQDLCNASDVVLFSAALPYQGGEDHINEQWPEYWGILFRKAGYRCFDPFRTPYWSHGTVESWYAQNALLFVRSGHPLCARLGACCADGAILSKVHPEIFLTNVTRFRPLALDQLQVELDTWREMVNAYVSGATQLPTHYATREGEKHGIPDLTAGRLNYRSAKEVASEYAGAMAQAQAAAQRTRDEKNSLINEAISAAVMALAPPSPGGEAAAESVAPLGSPDSPNTLDGHHDVVWYTRRLPPNRVPRAFSRLIPKPLRKPIQWAINRADIRYLRSSPYFSAEWYRQHYEDVAAAGIDPAQHFVTVGSWEFRKPHPQFETSRFVAANRLKARVLHHNPFVQFLKANTEQVLESKLGRPAASSMEALEEQDLAGVVGWYGSSALMPQQFYERGRHALVRREQYEKQTREIIQRYLQNADVRPATSSFMSFAPVKEIESLLAAQGPRLDVPPNSRAPSYSIITPFFKHTQYFAECARSVQRVIESVQARDGAGRVEWIILNDDPSIEDAVLEQALPAGLKAVSRIVSDGQNLGISRRQNQGLALAAHEWVLLLDCDDRLEPHCINVLDHYAATFPQVRFISASIIDIDDQGKEMRRRLRHWGVTGLFGQGMNAGHLVAVRKDLAVELGGFDPQFSGCQDYDLALRTAAGEAILLIPEHLYCYRWHTASQSVHHHQRQAEIAENVRKAFALRFANDRWPEAPRPRRALPARSRGICLIRTQGRRLDLLEETIMSVLRQQVGIDPCIIVHAGAAEYQALQRWVTRFGDAVTVLHAPDTSRRRGYPLNVGLDHVERHAQTYDFFCILDDDDIYYPFFSERMTQALSLSGADVVYCKTNSRVPGQHAEAAHPPLPTAALVAGNFIPINAYVVRTDLLTACGARLREDLHYLEDWDFLLSLMQADASFFFLDETLAEFRLIGDGNAVVKRDPVHFEHCRHIVLCRGALVAGRAGPGRFHRDILDFDFATRVALDAQAQAHVRAAMAMFERAAQAAQPQPQPLGGTRHA